MMIRCNNCFNEYEENLGLCPFCGYADGELAPDAFCLSPGTMIADRYVIGEKINAGGFGIVYKAWDKKLETIIAIKEYYPSGLVNRLPGKADVMLVASKREREFVYGRTRFLDEARNMAKFSSHKNIVNVYHFFEENNTAYIIMEYLSGRTLSGVLQQQNVPLPYDYCVNIAAEVCEALKAIHKENILHRDVSPDNIMICSNGTVKLLDFGAARFSAGVENKVTVVVKPGFAPPEQYDKVNRQDTRTDIYALGATLYYAMTGIRPEESTNRKIEDTLAEPVSIDSNIPQSISTAIMRAMAIEQQYRFSDIDEFKKALLNEKKVLSVQKERAKRKRRRAFGIFFSLLMIVGAAGAFMYTYNDKKSDVVLPDSELDVWYIQTGIDDVDQAKTSALDSIIQTFTSEFSNVTVNLTPVDHDNYTEALLDAIENGNTPEVFEATGITANLQAVQLADVSDSLNDLSADSYYNSLLTPNTQYPTGIVLPTIYVNTTMGTVAEEISGIEQLVESSKAEDSSFVVKASVADLYTALYGSTVTDYISETAKNDFFERKAFVYLGDSSDYFEVQEALPGEYSVLLPSSEKAVYRSGMTWSMPEQDNNTAKAASALIRYFTSDLAQDYLHLQYPSGNLPIIKTSMEKFVEVYNEFSAVDEYLTHPFSEPEIPELQVQPEVQSQPEAPKEETSLITIPRILSQENSWGFNDEYRPQVVFGEDGHCEFRFNMATWIYDLPATYKVFSYPDGKHLIECDLNTTEFGDGINHFASVVYFTESSDGTWTFWCENIGLTPTGTQFLALNDDKTDVKPEEISDIDYVQSGRYLGTEDSNSPNIDEIKIRTDSDSTVIEFDVFWYRLTSMDNAKADLYGNLAFFYYEQEDSDVGTYDETYGYLKFADSGTVTLTILDTQLAHIDPRIDVFSFISEAETKSKAEQYTLETLLLNDDTNGWSGSHDVCLRFYKDGSITYWIGHELGGEMTYTKHDGKYQLDGSMIYIDDCAYELIWDSGAMPVFYLTPINEDVHLLGGGYSFGDDELYCSLNTPI